MITTTYTHLSDDALYTSIYTDLDALLSSTTSPHSLVPSRILVQVIMYTIKVGLEIGAW